MNNIAGSVLPIKRAEELILTLPGVVSAKIIERESGAVEQIHVLTTGELTPRQVVRNIESALMAHLAMRVDHRRISVAITSEPRPKPTPAHPTPARELGKLSPFQLVRKELQDVWNGLISRTTALHGFRTEGTALAAELDELDQTQPGWDEVTRLAGARNAFRIGLPREVITAIYGDQLTSQAEGASQETVKKFTA